MFFTLSDCLFSVVDSINLIWRRHICRGFSFVRWHAKLGLFKSFDCSLCCLGLVKVFKSNCIHLAGGHWSARVFSVNSGLLGTLAVAPIKLCRDLTFLWFPNGFLQENFELRQRHISKLACIQPLSRTIITKSVPRPIFCPKRNAFSHKSCVSETEAFLWLTPVGFKIAAVGTPRVTKHSLTSNKSDAYVESCSIWKIFLLSLD